MRRGVLLCSMLAVAVAVAAGGGLMACTSLAGLASGTAGEGGAPDASSDDGPATDALPDVASSPSDGGTEGDAAPPACPPGIDYASNPAHCGRCNHDCLGGGCAAGVCQPTALAINQAYPFGLAIDDAHVYWTTQADGTAAPRITKAALDGSGATPLCTTPSSGVTLASDATNIYVSSNSSYGWCPKAGGSYATLTNVAGRGIGADGTFVYVINAQASNIGKVKPVATPQVTLVTNTGSPAEFLTVSNGVVFWTELSAGNVFGCPVGGCLNGATPFATGRQSPRGIAATATTLYWVESTGVGSVQSCPISGCVTPTPIAGNQNTPYAVTADSSGVYWTTTAEIRMCPASGCGPAGPTTLAHGLVSPDSIVTDATAVYWCNNAKPGQVMRVAK